MTLTMVPLMEAALRRARELAAEDAVAAGLVVYLERHIPEELHGGAPGRAALDDLEALGIDTVALRSEPPPPKMAAPRRHPRLLDLAPASRGDPRAARARGVPPAWADGRAARRADEPPAGRLQTAPPPREARRPPCRGAAPRSRHAALEREQEQLIAFAALQTMSSLIDAARRRHRRLARPDRQRDLTPPGSGRDRDRRSAWRTLARISYERTRAGWSWIAAATMSSSASVSAMTLRGLHPPTPPAPHLRDAGAVRRPVRLDVVHGWRQLAASARTRS